MSLSFTVPSVKPKAIWICFPSAVTAPMILSTWEGEDNVPQKRLSSCPSTLRVTRSSGDQDALRAGRTLGGLTAVSPQHSFCKLTHGRRHVIVCQHVEAVMMNCSLGWMLVALGLGALHPIGASAQDDPFAPLPAGVTACKFGALVKPVEPGWWVIRNTPRQDGREVGRLPAVDNTRYLPEIQVIGVKDGWFMIEGAAYPESDFAALHRPRLGRGQIRHDASVSRYLEESAKQRFARCQPSLRDQQQRPSLSTLRPRGAACPWMLRSVARGRDPSAECKDCVRKTCSDRRRNGARLDRQVLHETKRRSVQGEQFDYPWSPLPAGVTECNFRALSNDPDPAGLNVRDAPDRNARVLGRLPPKDIGRLQDGSFIVRADVQVFGYRKGWFLIEAGSYHDAVLPPHGPQPYSGRGWVAGNMLTAGLLHGGLKQAPNEKSADVIDLLVRDKEGIPHLEPHGVKLRPIIACSGDWVQVEVALEKGMTPLLESGASKGAPRGWVNGTCAEQFVPCGYEHMPWSPPAPLPPE